MKNLLNIIILVIITFGFVNISNAQTAREELERANNHRRAGRMGAAVHAYNNAKRIAHQNSDWSTMLLIAEGYVLTEQKWAAQNAFSLAFRYSYDMAIGDPNKTRIARNCRSGRSGLRAVVIFWNNRLNPIVSDMKVANNMFYNAKQAENATNWLNYHYGNGCPQQQAKASISTSKSRYNTNENIVVNFGGMPGNNNDLITIVDSQNNLVRYYYTGGDTKGGVRFKPLPSGTYEARARFAAGRIEASKRFTVGSNNTSNYRKYVGYAIFGRNLQYLKNTTIEACKKASESFGDVGTSFEYDRMTGDCQVNFGDPNDMVKSSKWDLYVKVK